MQPSPLSPDIIPAFIAWGESRGYAADSVATWSRMARRLILVTARSLPTSPDVAVAALLYQRPHTRRTRNSYLTGMRRLYEFLRGEA